MHVEADLSDHKTACKRVSPQIRIHFSVGHALEPHFLLHNIEGHLLGKYFRWTRTEKLKAYSRLWNDHSISVSTEKIYFSTRIVQGEGWTLLSVVWYVNFSRLWKYFYDQSMWMFRIALCCLLICFSTTHKRFQHHTLLLFLEKKGIQLGFICHGFW